MKKLEGAPERLEADVERLEADIADSQETLEEAQQQYQKAMEALPAKLATKNARQRELEKRRDDMTPQWNERQRAVSTFLLFVLLTALQ